MLITARILLTMVVVTLSAAKGLLGQTAADVVITAAIDQVGRTLTYDSGYKSIR